MLAPPIISPPERLAVDVEQSLDAFERAWHDGQPPDIAQILADACRGCASDDRRRAVINEIVMVDLWHRWKRDISSRNANAGDSSDECSASATAHDLPSCPRLNDYVRLFAELITADDLSVDAIGEEYRVRRRFAEPPSHTEYLVRFPRRAAELEEVLAQIDRETPPANVSASTSPYNAAQSDTQARSARLAGSESSIRFTPQRIGKYIVLETLDRGGQAKVYRAVHPQLRQTVAIKLGHALPRGSGDVREMLIREARLLAKLDHPHLVRVYDLDFHNDRPFVVMDYVRGRNLRQLAEEETLTHQRSAAIVAGIATALAAVHAQGITHRDVKPENILIDEEGQPRLIDFGLARDRTPWSTVVDSQEGVTGTLLYMAPEQASGDSTRIGPRTDIFGLGGVLFYLLVGGPPIAPGSFDDVLSRVRDGDVQWEALQRSSAPPALVEICRKAMSPDADDRYQDAVLMAADLDRFVKRRRWKWPLWIAAFILAVVVIFGLTLAWPLFAAGNVPTPPVPENASVAADFLERAPRRDFPFKAAVVGQPSAENRITLVDGQKIALQLTSDVDCYIGLWYIDAARAVTQLYPNTHQQDHFLTVSESLIVPGDDKYSITVHQADGPEYIYAVASSRPWPAMSREGAGEDAGPALVFASPEELRQWQNEVRGVSLVAEEAPRVAEEVIEIHVQPAP
jgi:serine/threonine protein kinase